MKKLDSKMMKYIAKTYGRKFAGDEGDPSASEVPPQDQATDQLLNQEESRLNSPTPPPGFDGSPEANPNVPLSPETLAQANLPPTSAAAPTEAPSAFDQAGVPDIEASEMEEKKANTEAAKAQGEQGKAEVEAIKAGQNAIAALPSASDITEDYKARDTALFKAYQAKQLDPNRYLNNMDTGKKIRTGIALILGGFSQNGNPVAKMIEDSINRDIDAQKNDQTQQMNLWKLNKEEYGNDLAANLATQNQILAGTKAELVGAASAAKGPIAQAGAQHANALIDQKMAENRFRLSLMKPTSDSFGLDPAKKVTWLVPPEKQAKVFDEIDAAQNSARNAPAILEAFDKASQEVRPLTGGLGISPTAFVPGMESSNQKAMHTLLGPTFKDVEGTVRQAAMDNIFHNTTPQFGDDDKTINEKRASLQQYLTSKSSAPTASGFGINLHEYPSTNVQGSFPSAPGSAAAQRQKSNAAPIKYDAEGRAWTRNAKGEVIPAGKR